MITEKKRANVLFGIATVLWALLLLVSPVKVFAQAAGTPGVVGTPPGTVGSPGVVGSPGIIGTPPTGTTTGSGLTNPLNVSTLDGLINEILGYAILLGGIFLSLMLVYVGFQFVMAQGNPEKVSAARSMLLWTAIGGMLLLGAQALSLVITTTVQSL